MYIYIYIYSYPGIDINKGIELIYVYTDLYTCIYRYIYIHIGTMIHINLEL